MSGPRIVIYGWPSFEAWAAAGYPGAVKATAPEPTPVRVRTIYGWSSETYAQKYGRLAEAAS